jgi:hypothetical protein
MRTTRSDAYVHSHRLNRQGPENRHVSRQIFRRRRQKIFGNSSAAAADNFLRYTVQAIEFLFSRAKQKLLDVLRVYRILKQLLQAASRSYIREIQGFFSQ